MEEFLTTILQDAITLFVTDIHINYENDGYQISFRKKSKVSDYRFIKKEEGIKLINYLKYKSNIDIINCFKPQTGTFSYNHYDKQLSFRTSCIPSKNHENMVIRVLNNHPKISLEKLSLLSENYSYLSAITCLNQGLVLFSGKTGSGKTTTLYTILETIKSQSNKHIVTLEDPVERELKEIVQLQIEEEAGMDFFNSLKQILRHDPDVIMIGEIRDEKTAKQAIQAALTGHLVFATIHASNCLQTIARLKEFKVSNLDIASCIKYLSNQRLYFNDHHDVTTVYEFIDQKEINLYLNNECLDYLSIEKLIQKNPKKYQNYVSK